MKTCLFLLMLSMAMPSYANYDMQIQMLDSQIASLQSDLAAKQKALSDCQSKLKTNKVVGGVTMATTAAGVVANVKLNEKLNSMSSGGGGGAGRPADTRSQEEKNCDSCAMFIEAGISPLPDECTGCA